MGFKEDKKASSLTVARLARTNKLPAPGGKARGKSYPSESSFDPSRGLTGPTLRLPERSDGATHRALYYCAFLLRSAHRRFIASESRFLPAGVRPPPRRLVVPELELLEAAAALRPGPLRITVPAPPRAAIALIIRSLSLFNSESIRSRSNLCSSVRTLRFRLTALVAGVSIVSSMAHSCN
jgi:hypothetical protein